MDGLTHPFSGALYEWEDEGVVRVTATDGRTGRFRRDGSRLDGELYDVDPQLCGWVGGPRAAHRLEPSTPKVS